MPEELLAIADELYGLTLAEFTPARDAHVKRLKGTDLAQPVKALRKPSLAAWVVNLLARRDPEQVEQVLTVGEALRAAQAAMSGDELRALTRQRRQLTAAVTTGARRLAREAGQKVTESVAEQVEATLTAAILDADCAAAVRSGLLVTALAATGVDDVDLARSVAVPGALGFVAAPTQAATPAPPELRIVPDPDADAKAVEAAQTELARAQAELDRAGADRDDAATAVADLEARSMQVQAEVDELRRQIAELEATAEQVDDEIEEASGARDEADAVVAEATAARDRAQAQVERTMSRIR